MATLLQRWPRSYFKVTTHVIHRSVKVNYISTMSESEKLFKIDKDYQTSVKEGQAEVFFAGKHDVFYNPVQEFNRDLSISVLRLFSQRRLLEKGKLANETEFPAAGQVHEDGVTILEALAASGLRSIRYAKEVGGIKQIIANDLSASAVESIKRNTEANNVVEIITANKGDASSFMYEHRGNKSRFDVIDLDPYGTPTPFLDAAIQSIADGGLLMVTATDMAVLCGIMAEACVAKYGSVPLKTKACHEMALRILLQTIQSIAARYGRYIHPLISVSVDFYIRCFMVVYSGKNEAKATATKLSTAYQCVNCHTLYWQPLMKSTPKGKGISYQRSHGPPTSSSCEYCNSRMNYGGPYWTDPIHDQDFVQNLIESLDNKNFSTLKTEKRIFGILSVILEELPDVPLYHALDRMTSFLKLSCPSLTEFRSAILHAGYKVSLSHCNRLSIKTDAPPAVLWDVLRCVAKKQLPQKEWPRPLPENPTAADLILSKATSFEANFEPHPEANPDSRKQKLVRFQTNPEKFWGPKARAKTSLLQGAEQEKRARKQNKRKGKQLNDSDRIEENEEKQPKLE